MPAPTIYRSSDASAPTLSGTAGDLVNLLDKCLVAGYGSKAAAGWSKPYTATNAAVFRMGGGNQFYLDVNDNGASNGLTGASGQEAAVRGYEAMTAVSTGTNPFPTVAQWAAATANWRKSATASLMPRGWFVAADDRFFILGIADGDSSSSIYKMYSFGDFYSLRPADDYRVGIMVRNVVNNNGISGTLLASMGTNMNTASAGFYIARIASQSGASVNGGLIGQGTAVEVSAAFPALDGYAYLARVMVTDAAPPAYLRGWMRGIYEVITPVGLLDGDILLGAGDFAGRAFFIVRGFANAGLACVAIETTPWDTN